MTITSSGTLPTEPWPSVGWTSCSEVKLTCLKGTAGSTLYRPPQLVVVDSVGHDPLARSWDEFGDLAETETQQLGEFVGFLHNSVQFQIRGQASCKIFGGLIENVIKTLGWDTPGTTRKKQKQRLVGAFVLGLFLAHRKNGCLAFAIDKSNFIRIGKKGRYWWLSYTDVKALLDLLKKWKVIESYKGNKKYKLVSRFWAVNEWSEYFTTLNKVHLREVANWESIPFDEVVLLKDEMKQIKEYPKKHRSHNLIKTYNKLITDTRITIEQVLETYLQKSFRESLQQELEIPCIHPLVSQYIADNPQKKLSTAYFNSLVELIEVPECNELMRVFNNGSFKQGGRLYHAVYQQLPEMIRRGILINSRKSIEIDYKCLHISILYHLEEKPLPDKLLYKFTKSDPLRRVAKIIVNSAFNAKQKDDAITSLFFKIIKENRINQWELSDALRSSEYWGEGEKYGQQLLEACQNIYEDFVRYHDPIKQYFNSGIGVKLQYYDSEMVLKVMRHFTTKNVPVLMIHDSIIAPEPYRFELKHLMEKVYLNRFGFKIEVK